jgi:CDP-diacylglycerol--serine O-phosphatidyltransferase
MQKLKTEASKDKLLRRMQKQRLNYIAVLPSLITLLNGVCGFASIIFASKGSFGLSGYMLLLAMIADMLDGRVARMSKNTSSFGGQLDSLCDMISFGLAPAFLMYSLLDNKLNIAQLTILKRFIWLAGATYISCAAIRLARFNVENEEDESAHMNFIGLPTPAAAGVIASLVILYEKEILPLITSDSGPYVILGDIIIYALPFLMLGVAILMVSRIQYPHIVNQNIKGKKPLDHLIRILLLGFILWTIQSAALALIFCGFAASGFAKWTYYQLKGKQNAIAIEPAIENLP